MLSQQNPRHCSRAGRKDRQEKSKHQLFMEAALDIKLVCLRNSSNAHCIPSELRSTSLQIEKEKKHYTSARGSIFHLTVCHRSFSLSQRHLHLLTDEKLNPALNGQFFDYTGQMKALKVREWCNMSWKGWNYRTWAQSKYRGDTINVITAHWLRLLLQTHTPHMLLKRNDRLIKMSRDSKRRSEIAEWVYFDQ